MVLNGDSTHPRPWRPPSEIEGMWKIYAPYRIYNGSDRVGDIVKGYNFFRDRDFSDQFFYGLRKGLGFGKSLTSTDLY